MDRVRRAHGARAEHLFTGAARGERVAVTDEAWPLMARAGPRYARRVWAEIGERWAAQHRADQGAAAPPGLSGRGLELWHRSRERLAARLAELRRLAGMVDQ